MSKRFTDADKWRDPWFVDLPPMAKLLWVYLCDNCDIAGVWQLHAGLCAAAIGCPVDLDAMRLAFGPDRVVAFDDGRKWHLRKFVSFQYPRGLSPKVSAQLGVIRRLHHHGLPLPNHGMPSSATDRSMGCQAQQDKDQDKDKDKDSNARATPTDPGDLFTTGSTPVQVIRAAPCPPIADIDHVINAGAFIGREERGAWQLLIEDHGVPKVVAAVRASIDDGKTPYRSEVAKRLGAAQKKPTAERYHEIDGVRYLVKE